MPRGCRRILGRFPSPFSPFTFTNVQFQSSTVDHRATTLFAFHHFTWFFNPIHPLRARTEKEHGNGLHLSLPLIASSVDAVFCLLLVLTTRKEVQAMAIPPVGVPTESDRGICVIAGPLLGYCWSIARADGPIRDTTFDARFLFCRTYLCLPAAHVLYHVECGVSENALREAAR